MLFSKLQCDLEEKNKFMRCDGAWQASNQGLWDLMSVTKNFCAEQVDQNIGQKWRNYTKFANNVSRGTAKPPTQDRRNDLRESGSVKKPRIMILTGG